jgi:acetoin utilization protein AcuB
MFVRNVMIEDVTAVAPEDPLQRAYDLMHGKRYDCLPVTTGPKRLAGIIQLTDIYEACMQHGREAGLALQVKDFMTKNLVTIRPDEPIERAAKLLFQRDIPFLPVVEDGQFKGIINEADIFKSFGDMLGVDSGTVRLTLVVGERKGQLARIAEIIRDAGVSITHLATFYSDTFDQYRIVVRVETDNHRPLVELLEQHGYKVMHADVD